MWRFRIIEEVTDMRTRPARTRTEIDFLPPFGKPEVVTVGSGAVVVALLGLLASFLLAR
jgi:hypothetical protein